MAHASVDSSRALVVQRDLPRTHRRHPPRDRRESNATASSRRSCSTRPRRDMRCRRLPRTLMAGRCRSGGVDASDAAARHRAHPHRLRPPGVPRLPAPGGRHVAIAARHRLGVHRRAQHHAGAGGDAGRQSAAGLRRAGHCRHDRVRRAGEPDRRSAAVAVADGLRLRSDSRLRLRGHARRARPAGPASGSLPCSRSTSASRSVRSPSWPSRCPSSSPSRGRPGTPRVVRYASSAVLGLSVLWFVERLQ